MGHEPVNVDGVFGYIPFVNQNNQVNLYTLGGIIAVVVLILIGIITLIVGIIIVILDRRKGREPIATK